MLYFKALWDGLDDMPTASPALRAELAEQAAAQGWPALHAELARSRSADCRTIAAAGFAAHFTCAGGVSRVWPAYVFFSTAHRAKPKSAMEADTAPAGLLISLEPDNRAWLHQRIAQRFDAMLAAGFLDEVRSPAGAS